MAFFEIIWLKNQCLPKIILGFGYWVFEFGFSWCKGKVNYFLIFFIIIYFSVQILAEEAHSLDAFDSNAAKAALDEATAAANAAGDDAAKAEAQIAVEVADALVKALAWIFAMINLDNSFIINILLKL